MSLKDELISLNIEEQINTHKFLQFCDYMYTPRSDYAYFQQIMREYPNVKEFSPTKKMDTIYGIIYVGMCVLIEDCLRDMPNDGYYIIIHRDNERPFTYDHYRMKKRSVAHIYTIECQVNEPDVTAIPFGTASIGGDSESLWQVQNEAIEKDPDVPVFCRLNTNKFTTQRSSVVSQLSGSPIAKVMTEQLDSYEFYREIKCHRFNLSLQSGGKDTTRTWETMFLGTIPIISDCVELRHFEDMPLVYYPKEGITKEWLDAQDVSAKTLQRVKMSYWRNEILNRKKLFC